MLTVTGGQEPLFTQPTKTELAALTPSCESMIQCFDHMHIVAQFVKHFNFCDSDDALAWLGPCFDLRTESCVIRRLSHR